MHGIKQHAANKCRRCEALRIGKNHIHIGRNIIRNTGFLDEADQEENKGSSNADICPAPRGFHLRDEIGCANNRTSNELRKEGDIECNVEKRPLGRNIPAIGVDHVRDGLKGEKADADREHKAQRDLANWQSDQARKVGKALRKEVEIFEDAQHTQHGDNAQRQPALLCLLADLVRLKPCADEIANRRDKQDQAKKTPIPNTIEDIGRCGQHRLALTIFAQGPDKAKDNRKE